MSKVEELREKYSKITSTTFNRFVEGDNTPTKKYLEYMLKMWKRKNDGHAYIGSAQLLTQAVSKFNELLPYIEKKDIYDATYLNFSTLTETINRAAEIKDEKTFVRDEHVITLEENDDYILLQPKTHRGSLKYGANTKWCTAARNAEITFLKYKNSGCLVYLIDKQNKKNGNYNKVAFYTNDTSKISGRVEIYNATDRSVRDHELINNGWDINTLIKIISIVRFAAFDWDKKKNAVKVIDHTLKIADMFDFESLEKSLKVIENSTETSYLSKVKETLNSFADKLKQIDNGITTTKN
jgi:hypothetical protein